MARNKFKSIILVMMVLTVVSSFAITPVSAATLTVDKTGAGDYNTIQSAVNDAADGDTIEIEPGTYYEDVEVTTGNLTFSNADPTNGSVVITSVKSNDDFTINDSSLASNAKASIGSDVTVYNTSTVVVGDSNNADYLSLGTAVSNIDNGTVVSIENGTYEESVTVDADYVFFDVNNTANPDVTLDASETSEGVVFSYNNTYDDTHVFVNDEIDVLNAALGGGGSSASGSNLGETLTGTFMGVPIWLIVIVVIAISAYWYSREE